MGKAIVIVGPTSIGKTSIAIELAKKINGEIISADSMQVYKYMDIGTAKPDQEEMSGIRHYLIDQVYPNEEFSVAKYKDLAIKYMDEISSRNKVPIIVGGTGLYINALVYNINFSDTITDWDLREKLKKEAEEEGNDYLHEKLRAVDPESADRIHKNDVKRVIRAIEVFQSTNKTISHHQKVSREEPSNYKFLIYGLDINRDVLYKRINERVDMMLEKGLIDEVKELIHMGYDKNTVSMQGLGYKEFLWYFAGKTTLEESVNLLKRDTRRYAKRQITWFKKLEEISWINLNDIENNEEVIRKIQSDIASSGIFL